LKCGRKVSSERFDDLSEQSYSVFGFLVGFSIEFDVGGSRLRGVDDFFLGEFKVLASESRKSVDSLGVFRLILNLVDDLDGKVMSDECQWREKER